MIIISSRKNFYKAGIISNKIKIKEVNLVDPRPINRKKVTQEELIRQVEGKRVCVIVHGYNTHFNEMCHTYHQIESQIKTYNINYDVFIGFAWPGGKTPVSYFGAKQRANKLSTLKGEIFHDIVKSSTSVDTIAHSLGCVLFLKFIKKSNLKNLNNIYLMAAAAKNDKICEGNDLYPPTKHCKGCYVFRSEDDSVLRKYFPVVENLSPALGHSGPFDIDRIFETVRVINCSDLKEPIKHGSYKHRAEIYKFIFSNSDITKISAKEVRVN